MIPLIDITYWWNSTNCSSLEGLKQAARATASFNRLSWLMTPILLIGSNRFRDAPSSSQAPIIGALRQWADISTSFWTIIHPLALLLSAIYFSTDLTRSFFVSQFDIMLSEDGSGRGAALVAAVACRDRWAALPAPVNAAQNPDRPSTTLPLPRRH